MGPLVVRVAPHTKATEIERTIRSIVTRLGRFCDERVGAWQRIANSADNRSTAAVTRKRKHDAMTTTPSTLPISIDEAKITATSTDSSTSMPEVHEASASIMHNGVAAPGTATASRTGEVKQLPRGTFA